MLYTRIGIIFYSQFSLGALDRALCLRVGCGCHLVLRCGWHCMHHSAGLRCRGAIWCQRGAIAGGLKEYVCEQWRRGLRETARGERASASTHAMPGDRTLSKHARRPNPACRDGSARLRTGSPLTAPHAREVLELLWYSISNMLETCNLSRSAEVVATSCHGQHQSLLGGPFGHVRGAWE